MIYSVRVPCCPDSWTRLCAPKYHPPYRSHLPTWMGGMSSCSRIPPRESTDQSETTCLKPTGFRISSLDQSRLIKWDLDYLPIRNTQYAMGLKVALQIRNTQYAIRNGSQSGQRIYAFCVFQYAIRNGPQRATCVFGSIRNTQKSSKIRSRSIRCVYRMWHLSLHEREERYIASIKGPTSPSVPYIGIGHTRPNSM